MLEAIFASGIYEVEVSGLTQWDRGQILSISVPDGLPSVYQVHFTYRGSNKALNVNVLDSTEVGIPDELLTQSRDLIAYIYLIGDDDSGETVMTVRMPVTPRAKPEDYSELPQTLQERFDSMLVSISDKADNAVSVSEEAKTIATEQATNAAQSAADAATSAADSASEAEKAADSAAAAQAAAEAARDAVDLTEEQLNVLMGDIDCGTFEEE